MKTKKHLRILCFILCFVLLLASCGQANPSTDISKPYKDSSVSEAAESSITEEQSLQESSKESSEELSEEPSEESSEPDYQVEMTEEMMREYLEFKNVSYPLEYLLDNYEVEDYDYKNDYIAFGNLNGYTLCGILPGITYGYVYGFPLDCVAGDYVILARGTGDLFDFCLYKDNEFISLNDAYEKGLFDGKDAYELINKNDKYTACAKKTSEIDYQVEMTEEMANAFLKFMGSDQTIQESTPEGLDYRTCYLPFGNLNGYTFFYAYGIFDCGYDSAISRYVAGDYLFESGHIMRPSKIGHYLYKDNVFMTFEDAYEQGLFNPDDAYELICAAGYRRVVRKLSDMTEEDAEFYRKNYSPEGRKDSKK